MKARFGECEFDTARIELSYAGEPVNVQPQVFALIEYLILHRDRVVKKEELLDEIWGDRFVGDATLASRIKFARRALGDDGQRQSVIKTVHGRGYRFVADVIISEDPVSASDADSNAPTTGASGASASNVASGRPFDAEIEDLWPLVGRDVDIETVMQYFADRDVGGVLITGPDQVGATRFAAECQRRIAESGPTWWVQGMASATGIPLSGLAHLLPTEVVHITDQADDLVRASLFHQALEVLETACEAQRPIVVIDDAPLLDELSGAVLAALITNREIFALLTGRAQLGTENASFVDGLNHGFIVKSVELAPLDEIEVDALLYRVLRGPIDNTSLGRLVEASEGRPGLLRDIVESTLRSGALVLKPDVWEVIGELSSRLPMQWPPDDQTDDARLVAEQLVLLGPARLDHLLQLVAHEGLNELDAAGLLTVRGDRDDPLVAMAPLLTIVIADSISPLRKRSLQAHLAKRLATMPAEPWALARLTEWGLASSAAPDDVFAAALAATAACDFVSAEVLATALEERGEPTGKVVLAEIAIWRGQWRLAEQFLNEADQASLDDAAVASVIGRQAELAFRFQGATTSVIDELEAKASELPAVAEIVRARRLLMMAFSARDDEVLAEAPNFAHMRDDRRTEVDLACATSYLNKGQTTRTIELLDSVGQVIRDQIAPAWQIDGLELITILRCGALLQRGELDALAKFVAAELPPGRRVRRDALRLLAAQIELECGRPRAARELVRETLATSRSRNYPLYQGWAACNLGRVDMLLGDAVAANRALGTAMERLGASPQPNFWRFAIGTAELASLLEQQMTVIPILEGIADQAAQFGAVAPEAELRQTAASIDRSPGTAQRNLARVVELGSSIEGVVWPIRLQHIQARAEQLPLDSVEQAYRSIGFVCAADRAAQGL